MYFFPPGYPGVHFTGCCKRQLIIRLANKRCRYLGVEILTALAMKSAIFWDVLPSDYTTLRAIHLQTHINFRPSITRYLLSNHAFHKRNSLMSLQAFLMQGRLEPIIAPPPTSFHIRFSILVLCRGLVGRYDWVTSRSMITVLFYIWKKSKPIRVRPLQHWDSGFKCESLLWACTLSKVSFRMSKDS